MYVLYYYIYNMYMYLVLSVVFLRMFNNSVTKLEEVLDWFVLLVCKISHSKEKLLFLLKWLRDSEYPKYLT